MIIRMDGILTPHHAAGQFNGAVRNHLIDVHVGLRARTGLPNPKWELISECAVGHLSSGLLDQRRTLRIQFSEIVVHLRGSELEHAERTNDCRRHRFMSNRKVVETPLGLRAPVMIRWYLNRAHRIGLHSHFTHRDSTTFSWRIS